MEQTNVGHDNYGNHNFGNDNFGHHNFGNDNYGNQNNGDKNYGNRNEGNENCGHKNSGDNNQGSQNIGHNNQGHGNWGDDNVGIANEGDKNIGCFNIGYGHIGLFNNKSTGYGLHMFNKPVSTLQARRISHYLMYYNLRLQESLETPRLSVNEWVSPEYMSQEEKNMNPSYTTLGGYLRCNEHREALKKWYKGGGLNMDGVKETCGILDIRELPHFDEDIFYDIVGVHLSDEAESKPDPVLQIATPEDIIELNGMRYARIGDD